MLGAVMSELTLLDVNFRTEGVRGFVIETAADVLELYVELLEAGIEYACEHPGKVVLPCYRLDGSDGR